MAHTYLTQGAKNASIKAASARHHLDNPDFISGSGERPKPGTKHSLCGQTLYFECFDSPDKCEKHFLCTNCESKSKTPRIQDGPPGRPIE